MGETVEWLCERLQSEGQKTKAYFQSLEPDQWELEVYTEGSCLQSRHAGLIK